jgi:hypothetical protein
LDEILECSKGRIISMLVVPDPPGMMFQPKTVWSSGAELERCTHVPLLQHGSRFPEEVSALIQP